MARGAGSLHPRRPRRRPRSRRGAAALLASALLLYAGALAGGGQLQAEEVAWLSFRGLGIDGQSAAATYSEMAAGRYEFDVSALLAGLGSVSLDLVLVDASPAARRQALAHALGCWWAAAPGGVVLTRGTTLPPGPLLVTSSTSTLVNHPVYEDLIRRLLKPWLGRDAGLSLLPDSGLWSATLDAAGQARLSELISVLEQGRAQCASVIPDPDQPDSERALKGGLRAASWPTLIAGLAEIGGCSVSLAHLAAQGPFPGGEVAIGGGSVGGLPAALRQYGISARFLHGVLCLERAGAPAPRERQHPGQRRLIALLPIAHLAVTDVNGELIAASLKRLSGQASGWWEMPGADLVYLPPLRALLVAADASTQQEVIALLHRIDVLGLEPGLRALAGDDAGAAPPR